MAEVKPKAKKRTVKNPETFRERAVKASEAELRPSRAQAATSGVKSVGKRAASPFARFFAGLFNSPVLKWANRPARVIGLVIFPKYLRNSFRELRLVTWPTWKQSRQLTFAVLIFAIVFGGSVALVDYGLDKLFRHILVK